MKCELCGIDIPSKRIFNAFIPGEGEQDEQISVCGRCHLLMKINENLGKLLAKENSGIPFMP